MIKQDFSKWWTPERVNDAEIEWQKASLWKEYVQLIGDVRRDFGLRSVVEFGCGSGLVCAGLNIDRSAYLGVDSSPEMIALVNMAYLPFRVFRIDRDTTGDLLDAVRWAGLSLPAEWAASTRLDHPRNSAGTSPLYAAYASGDIKTIRTAIPLAWSSLILMQPVLRPFLEKYGYENLLWWD